MVDTTVQWTEDLSVGVEELDNDHKKLISLLNEIFIACFAGVGEAVMKDTIRSLRQYTHDHFQREEKLLSDAGYPSCSSHAEEHARLIGELDKIVERIEKEEDGGFDMEVQSFLRAWLIDHINERDKDYAKFLKEIGATPS